MPTSERECIEALREAAERLGESPTKAEYEALGLTPASATIIRVMSGWNAAKEAAGLETNPSRGSRVEPKPEDVALPEDQEWSELSVDQRWHYRNVEWNAERTLARRARLRSWANRRKHDRGCARCGVDGPACLDFHHPDSDRKTMAITRMITYGHGKESLRDEMADCEVLCANCHRREHASPSASGASGEGLRQWIEDFKASSGGCRRCDERYPACLDFHHGGDVKGATVSDLISNGRSRTEVLAEIEQCTLLCANCHRKEHFEPPDSPA